MPILTPRVALEPSPRFFLFFLLDQVLVAIFSHHFAKEKDRMNKNVFADRPNLFFSFAKEPLKLRHIFLVKFKCRSDCGLNMACYLSRIIL